MSPASNLPVVPFYEHGYLAHDLRRGSVSNRFGTKMCMMPGELMFALKQVLEEETGPEWHRILLRVGRIWGRRVARRFQADLSTFFGRPLQEMPMREFIPILEGYFRYHGWGRLTLDLSEAETGFVFARLENSAFAEAVGVANAPVDAIVCGLLGEFLCQISERTDIDCVETECVAMGRPQCMFIIGLESRLQTVRNMLEEGHGHEEIVTRICPAREKRINDADTQEAGRNAFTAKLSR